MNCNEQRFSHVNNYNRDIFWDTSKNSRLEIDLKDDKGKTALHYVHDLQTAGMLLEARADVTCADSEGNTPLHTLCLGNSVQGDDQVCVVFLAFQHRTFFYLSLSSIFYPPCIYLPNFKVHISQYFLKVMHISSSFKTAVQCPVELYCRAVWLYFSGQSFNFIPCSTICTSCTRWSTSCW